MASYAPRPREAEVKESVSLGQNKGKHWLGGLRTEGHRWSLLVSNGFHEDFITCRFCLFAWVVFLFLFFF